MADLCSKSVWVPKMCMEGAICIGTNLDDKQTPLIIAEWGLHPICGLNDHFLDPNYRKISLEKHQVFICSIIWCCVWLPWIALGTLVVIHDYEGDQFQGVPTQSTLFDVLLAPAACTTHVLGEGYRGHL